MHSFHPWKLQPSEQVILKKWRYGMLVFGVSLILFALATAATTKNRSDLADAMANTHHGAGNLIPVF